MDINLDVDPSTSEVVVTSEGRICLRLTATDGSLISLYVDENIKAALKTIVKILDERLQNNG